MIAPIDVARGIWLLSGGLTLGLAGLCTLWRGPADGVGVLLGSGLTLANFGGLTWAAARVLAGSTSSRAVWIGASGVRLGILAVVAGLAVTHTGVGLVGLLLSLTLVPVAAILAGLRAAHVA